MWSPFPESASVWLFRWCVVGAAVLVASCSALQLGGPRGTEESLEADIALLRDGIRDVAAVALGPAELIGESVLILPCDPDDAYRASVQFTYAPDPGESADGRTRILSWMDAEGIEVDDEVPEAAGSPIFFEPVQFDRQLRVSTSDGRVPGVEIGSSSGCYGPDRIDAPNPYDLDFEEGVGLDFQE